jgi:PIN domain nuclease of toxin-antitoxin system
MILLDTNAAIWLHQGHRRGRRLERQVGQLYLSPASLLELQFLVESGRIQLRPRTTVRDVAADDRWVIDNPTSADWFGRALGLSWTRDPFDRLLVAHADLRGWRLATGDGSLLDRLGPHASLELQAWASWVVPSCQAALRSTTTRIRLPR